MLARAHEGDRLLQRGDVVATHEVTCIEFKYGPRMGTQSY